MIRCAAQHPRNLAPKALSLSMPCRVPLAVGALLPEESFARMGTSKSEASALFQKLVQEVSAWTETQAEKAKEDQARSESTALQNRPAETTACERTGQQLRAAESVVAPDGLADGIGLSLDEAIGLLSAEQFPSLEADAKRALAAKVLEADVAKRRKLVQQAT